MFKEQHFNISFLSILLPRSILLSILLPEFPVIIKLTLAVDSEGLKKKKKFLAHLLIFSSVFVADYLYRKCFIYLF